MNNTGIIDQFLDIFTRYIDSGFGLVHGEVAFIASTLIVIDMTLAALFWTFEGAGENEILLRLIKKTLFIGAFAYLISNWNGLAKIIFNSFASLGLQAAGGTFTMADLMRPGKLAQTGLDAGQPLLQAASDLMGGLGLVENLVQIACLLLAWVLVVLAFFIIAIQMFVTLIEFKLTTLAGFVLMPFGLFNKSAFMAEKVLGNVVSSGIKVLVLAVVTGIGSTLFSTFVTTFGGVAPSIEDAMSIVLAALTLLGLGIFGPAIANGLVSGGPQMGAGAAVGAAVAAGGTLMAGGAALGMAARGAGAAVAGGGAALRGAAQLAGGVSGAYSMGAMGRQGAAAVAGGLGNVAKTGAQATAATVGKIGASAASGLRSAFQQGTRDAFTAGGGTSTQGTVSNSPATSNGSSSTPSGPPDWAKRMKNAQTFQHGVSTVTQAVRSGDAHGAGHSISLNART